MVRRGDSSFCSNNHMPFFFMRSKMLCFYWIYNCYISSAKVVASNGVNLFV